MKKQINNGIFYVVISLVAVLGIAGFVTAYNGTANTVIENFYGGVVNEASDSPTTIVENQNLGGNPGGYFNTQAVFSKGFVKGGDVFNASSTLYVARTITSSEICNNGTITVNSSATAADTMAASTDLTLAATTTLFMDCLRNEGDEVTFDFLNQSPTAASTTQIVAGTGCQVIYGVADGDDTIPGQKGATITVKRITDWLADGGTKDCIIKVYEWN